jgi:hypothetical protein
MWCDVESSVIRYAVKKSYACDVGGRETGDEANQGTAHKTAIGQMGVLLGIVGRSTGENGRCASRRHETRSIAEGADEVVE